MRIETVISMATLAVSTAVLVLVLILFVTGDWGSRERDVEHSQDLTVTMLQTLVENGIETWSVDDSSGEITYGRSVD